MSWWDDTWLSEGFATYAQYLGINNVYPDWKPVRCGPAPGTWSDN